MFLTLCFQLRGRSTVAAGGWFEKTTADWMEALGASKRTVETVVRFMCHDDNGGAPLGAFCLGLVRRRRGGFRNSAQYLVDELRANAFWLTHGPQPVLRGQLEIQPPNMDEVDSLVSHEVDSLVSHEVDSLVSHEVDSLVSQPHQKHINNNMKNIINSADAPAEEDDVLVKLLRLYGFTDVPTIKGTAAKLTNNIAGADLTIYLTGELAHIEADRRAGTKYAIANLPGWICRQLQQVDPAASELTLAIADGRIEAALVAAGHGQRRPVGVDDTADQRSHRRAEFERITGRTGETAAVDTHDDDQAAAALAEIERRRLARMARQQTG